MKYSFMSFSCPQLTFQELLGTAKKYGYDGIEPRTASKHNHGVEIDADSEMRKKIREEAKNAGISIACVATSCIYANPEIVEQNVKQTVDYIDLASDIGCSRIRVFGGIIPKDVTRAQAMELIIKSLSSVAEHAKEKGVYVCMETHDDWCNPEYVAEIMKKVNHPNIAVNWDIAHPVIRNKSTMDEAYNFLNPWVKHVHFHDIKINESGKNSLVPIGEGLVDHKVALASLKKSSYDGFLSGEWIKWEPYEQHLPREIATLKNIESKI